MNRANESKIIFVMGAPGSGKGTQCKLIEKNNPYYCHIAAGDIVRNLIRDTTRKNSQQTQEICEKVQRGELLDDQMMLDLIQQEIALHPGKKAYLIDGYPRTQKQLELFEQQVAPVDKVIYLQVEEAIAAKRLKLRAQEEARLDDNDETIQKRFNFYKNATLPLIQSLQQTRADKFVTIDATDKTPGEVHEFIRKQVLPAPMNVGFWEFLKIYLSQGNFYAAIDELENRYHAIDFQVTLAYTTLFYILQNQDDVKQLLTANTITGYQNHNFDVASGHDLNINALQAFASAENSAKNLLWQTIHNALAQVVGDKQLINALIKKHIHRLFTEKTFELDINFENFMLDFWCEYLFGDQVKAADFKETRAKTLAALRYTFYDSRLKTVPVIGTQACRFYHYLKKDEFAQIDKELQAYIGNTHNGLVGRLKEKLTQSKDFPADKITQAVLDNTFDFILIFDFIHNAMYETLVEIIKNKFDTTSGRKQAYTQGLKNAYLFPFRARTPQTDLVLPTMTIGKGTPVYLNLLKSGLYHSFGPRACVGISVTQWIKEAIWQQLEGIRLRIVDVSYPENRARLAHSKDVPISPERYQVEWEYPREYLQNNLPAYPFKGVDKFYDVLKTFENSVLTTYVVADFMAEIDKLRCDRNELCIVTPEVRGIPIAAMLANQLHIPLVVLRKPGKIPGPVISTAYANAYGTDCLEISTLSDVKDKQVIFIDDGISSGGTTKASCELVKQLGGQIALVLGMINHTYKEKSPALLQYPVHTLFDFTGKAAAPQGNISIAKNTASFYCKPEVRTRQFQAEPESKRLAL